MNNSKGVTAPARPALRSARRALPLIVLAASVFLASTAVWVAARGPGKAATPAAQPADQSPPPRARGRNLALRPEAYAAARRLGARFLRPGRDHTVLNGELIVGGERRRVRVVREQRDGGEHVAVHIAGRRGLLTWEASEGARSEGAPAEGDDLDLIERIVFGGADQFVLAQSRGASYRTLARDARPREVGGSDSYDGPVWDLVLVTEPRAEGAEGDPARSRLYHVNSATGLVERVVWDERGGRVTAEITGWAERGGEWSPARVVWRKGGARVTELVLAEHSFGPGQ